MKSDRPEHSDEGSSPEIAEQKPVSIEIGRTTVYHSPDGEWPRTHNGGPDGDVVITN